MTGSAQLEVQPESSGEKDTFALVCTLAGPAAQPSLLKQEVSERLAEHRRRRARLGVATAVAQESQQRHRRGDAQKTIAATVAQRYAQSPSYRAFLAQEAERALVQAAAAAEVAQRNAQAVAAVQQELLAELEKWDAPQQFTPDTAAVVGNPAIPVQGPVQSPVRSPVQGPVQGPVKQVSTAGLTVKLYEDLGRTVPVLRSAPPSKGASHKLEVVNATEARALDEEIAFRQAPVFEDYRNTEPAVPIPANLLEFPRQLVAAVRARPSLALGPLREESGPRSPQLRIFEVEPDQIATVPEPLSLTPEWSSIFLDAQIVTELAEEPGMPSAGTMPQSQIMPSLLPPQTAPVHLRLMAAAVDSLLVLGGFVAFAAAFARVAGPVTLAVPLAIAAVVMVVALYLAYQLLFFTLTDQTPGMRYARIGLCTFSDENPTRRAMRKRVLAQVVAVAPLGLGLAWALLDEDRLGWHDRMSRMYQRAY